MLEITGLEGQKARVVVKLECFNPGGSVKDRAALHMIDEAERQGLLRAGATIIEPTSGNTGIGIAWIARARGYKTILTMPDTMSLERRQLLAACGATIVLTPGSEGMNGAVAKANELHRAIADSVILGQFSNPANPAIHEQTTGVEIWQQTEGQVDVFVAGVGTGGTLTGVARALKKHKRVEIVAVEPAASQVLAGKPAASHLIQGIGANFVPDNLDTSLVDKILPITNEAAIAHTQWLAQRYGLLAGISSGAALAAAAQLASREEYRGKTIVALLPDTGERYLSTGIFAL